MERPFVASGMVAEIVILGTDGEAGKGAGKPQKTHASRGEFTGDGGVNGKKWSAVYQGKQGASCPY